MHRIDDYSHYCEKKNSCHQDYLCKKRHKNVWPKNMNLVHPPIERRVWKNLAMYDQLWVTSVAIEIADVVMSQ